MWALRMFQCWKKKKRTSLTMSSNLSFRWECPRLALSMVCKSRFKRVSKDCCFAAHKRLSASSICFSIATLASSASMLLRSSTIAAWKTCGKLETASHTDWSRLSDSKMAFVTMSASAFSPCFCTKSRSPCDRWQASPNWGAASANA